MTDFYTVKWAGRYFKRGPLFNPVDTDIKPLPLTLTEANELVYDVHRTLNFFPNVCPY